jgi:hypothetical protein
MTRIDKNIMVTIFLFFLACLVILALHLIGYKQAGFLYHLF